VGTPGRALQISSECREFLVSHGFKILSFSDFKNLRHCISILSHAKKVITSWGNIAAANRFFYSSDAEIVLLGNMAYSNEYEKIPDTGCFGLLVFPVNTQYVVRGFPDAPSIPDIRKAINILGFD
jgi:hypothetical protein